MKNQLSITLLSCGVALALALGLTAGSEAQGPIVLRNSSGTELATSTNPVRIDPVGTTTQPVNVTNGSATATVNGQANTALVWMQFPALQKGGTAAMTGTTSTQVIAAVASNYLYITSCSVNNTHASVDTLVDLQDGSGGTVIWTFTAPHAYLGESHSFPVPLRVTTLGNALFAVNETTGASVKVFCQGFASTVAY